MKKKLLFAMVALAVFAGAALAQDTVWTRRYNANWEEKGNGIAWDTQGRLYVVAAATQSTMQYLLTLRYTPAGDTVWSRRFVASINGGANAVALDGSGNAYVVGWAYNGNNVDYRMVVYNPNGDTLWTLLWDGSAGDVATGVALDGSGNIFLTGTSAQGLIQTWMTLKLNRWGDTLWTRRYVNGTRDSYAEGLAVDGSGNVYIVGYTSNGSNSDIQVFKRGPNGDSLWARRWDLGSNEYGYGITTGPGGSLYVTGATGSPSVGVTIKANATTGDTIWTRRYTYGRNNWGYNAAVDQAGNIFVAMTVANRNNNDFGVVKYSSAGDSLWASLYDSGREDVSNAVAADTSGNVYVTGYSYNGTNNDVLTIKYHPTGTGVYEREFLTPPRAGAGLRLSPNPARTACAIRLDWPVAGLAVYDFAGRLVRKFDSPATDFVWDLRDGQGRRLENGVFLVRAETGGSAETRRVVVLR